MTSESDHRAADGAREEADVGASEASSNATTAGSAWQWLKQNRRRVATASMIALLLLLATHGSQVLPSTLELSLPVADAAHVTRLEATLIDSAGDEAHRITRRYEAGAEDALDFEVSLLPGRYDVELRTTRPGGETLLVGHVEAPAEGRVRVHLSAP